MKNKIPIIYQAAYNFSMGGTELFHPFDSEKYHRITTCLLDSGLYNFKDFLVSREISTAHLLEVHDSRYLDSLKQPMTISRIAEMQVLATIPASVLDEQILKPMRLGTGGTLLASQIALEKGVAINLSGGYHHAKPHEGDGFCFYADVPCAIQQLRKTNPNLEILIIDLDAHQGNGNAVCCKDDPLTEILDIYNQDIFPQDKTVKGLIKWDHPISGDIPESEYLSLLDYTLTNVLSEYSPDLIIYNAGTDILAGDPLGQFSISAEGICTRDLLVFQQAKEQQIPLAMVLSGGYTKESSKVIGESILNLCNKLEGF